MLTAIIVLAATIGATAATAQGLPAPDSLTATAQGQTVTLQWGTSVFPPYRVRVEAGTAPGVTTVSFSQSPTYNYGLALSNVPTGTYYVRVRIEKDGQVSGPSNEAVVTVAGCPTVPAPPAIQAESTGQTVDLRWTYDYPPGCFPSSLRLEAGSSPGASDLLTMDVADYNATMRQFHSVPIGTYYLRVRADRFGVMGPPSNEVRLDVGCVPPPPIVNPLATVSGNAVRFSWEYGAAASADFGVHIEAGAQPGGIDIGAIPVPAGAFSGVNVAGAAGVYFTRLRATNACGSTVSQEMPVTLTSECVPPEPVPFADAHIWLGNDSVSLLWSPPGSGGPVMSYDIEVGTAPGQADLARRTVEGRYLPPYPGDFTQVFTVPAERAYLRVTSRNACGAARPTEVYATNVNGCVNLSAPRSLSARVTGNTVVLWWDWTGPESPYGTFVEIGRSPGASDVFVSPRKSTYPPPVVTTSLPPGRYYARARNVNTFCGGSEPISNPSPEVTFEIP